MARYRVTKKPNTQPRRGFNPLWLILAGLGLVLVAAWAALGGRQQPNANVEVKGAPRLKVENDLFDHGDVKLGTPVRDDIRVTNVGDQPLRFSEAPYVEIKEGC